MRPATVPTRRVSKLNDKQRTLKKNKGPAKDPVRDTIQPPTRTNRVQRHRRIQTTRFTVRLASRYVRTRHPNVRPKPAQNAPRPKPASNRAVHQPTENIQTVFVARKFAQKYLTIQMLLDHFHERSITALLRNDARLFCATKLYSRSTVTKPTWKNDAGNEKVLTARW